MRKIALTSALVLASAAALAADPNAMKPGLWEYTTKMEVPGAPFAMPPQTAQQCVTAADVAKSEVDPATEGQKGDCQVRNFKRSGATVGYDVVCSGAQPSTSQVKVTTTATTTESTTTMDMGGRKMTNRTSGKRVGDCKG